MNTEERRPVTTPSLRDDFLQIGLSGKLVLVHSSLKSIGWVNGSECAVIEALMLAVGPDGTIVMPAHSGDYSDPARWVNPPVPESWWKTIRETMPAFNPRTTPTFRMGAIPELFRTYPDVLRSYHPAVSFSAWGRLAHAITDNHSLDFAMGDNSPLGRIYEHDGYILQIGTNHETNTSLHLAEYRAEYKGKEIVDCGGPIHRNGQRVWAQYRDVDYDSDDFGIIGAEFEATHPEEFTIGKAGSATTKLFRQKPIVDFATAWMNEKGRKLD